MIVIGGSWGGGVNIYWTHPTQTDQNVLKTRILLLFPFRLFPPPSLYPWFHTAFSANFFTVVTYMLTILSFVANNLQTFNSYLPPVPPLIFIFLISSNDSLFKVTTWQGKSVIKKNEEQYSKFLLLPLFNFLLLCRIKRKYVNQIKPVGKKGINTKRTYLSLNNKRRSQG